MQNLGRLIANRGPDRSLALWAGGLNERRPSADRADTQWVLGVRLLLSSAGRPRQRTAVVSGTRERVGGDTSRFRGGGFLPVPVSREVPEGGGMRMPGPPPHLWGRRSRTQEGGPFHTPRRGTSLPRGAACGMAFRGGSGSFRHVLYSDSLFTHHDV